MRIVRAGDLDSHFPVYILLLFFHRKYDKMAEGGMKQNENFSDRR